MSSIEYVQFDQLPALRVRLANKAKTPLDVSSAEVSILANLKFKGQFKEAISGAKAPGSLTAIDRRTKVWTVDETAPFDVPGSGGIVLFFPSATSFDQPGLYQVEYEIKWSPGVSQTVYEVGTIQVRKQIN